MLSVKPKTERKVVNPWTGKVVPSLYMTEDEFVAWCDDKTRAEWVDGKVVIVSPSSVEQDDLNGWLSALLRMFLDRQQTGSVYGPNVTVRFATQRRRRVPDLIVVLKHRLHLIRKAHLEGAPDLVMEIVAPESQTRDRREKFAEYEKAGVREYWIIDQLTQQVEVYALKRGRYVALPAEKDIFRSTVLAGFYLRPAWLWKQPLPSLLKTAKELDVL